MREAEWEKWLRRLVGPLPQTVSDRKRRLFACACVRRIWHLLTDQRSASAVEIAERFADELCDGKALDAARERARRAEEACRRGNQRPDWKWWAARAAVSTTYKRSGDTIQTAYNARAAAGLYSFPAEEDPDERIRLWRSEAERQADLLRDILGNLGYLPTLDPSWLRWNDGTVPRIVQGIYEERAFDRLPILADALLDAGCDDEALLSHCRSAGPHVRGCWAVDAILGRQT
jgi:hypothetical protein